MSSRPESRATTSSPPNAANATTPFAPGQTNAWTEILALNKAEAKSLGDVGRPDSVLFVLGASGSGKTTLIRRLLYGGGGGDGGANTRGNETRNSSPKPGEGLEYHYARKSRATDSSRKDVAHVFEVSGSKEFADLLCGKDTVFFGARQVTTATALVTIDLSKPAEAVASLQYFLGKIKQAVTKTFTKLRTRGSRLPEQLKQRHRKQFNKFGKSEHPDFLGGQLTGDSLCGVQIVIACTKHDLHVNYDPEQRKVLSRALRNLAHRNGASLFYVQSSKSLQINSRDGGLNGRDNGSNDDRNNRLNDPTPNDPQNLQFTKLRAFVNHLVFVGADKAFPKTLDTEVDHLKPVLVVSGSDSFPSIGAPPGGRIGETRNDEQAWADVCLRMFPAVKTSSTSGGRTHESWVSVGDDAERQNLEDAKKQKETQKYSEPEVDQVASQKLEELGSFMKQQSMASR